MMFGVVMETGKIKNIACPCCKKSLYRLEQAKRGSGDAIWLTTTDSPRVESDNDGHFIACAYCSKRIAMIEVPGIPEAAFDVSPFQECNKILKHS